MKLRLLNLRKRRVVKKIYEPMPGYFGPSAGNEMEEEGEGEYTLEEFYKYHFLKKNDLSSYLIKSRVLFDTKSIIMLSILMKMIFLILFLGNRRIFWLQQTLQ